MKEHTFACWPLLNVSDRYHSRFLPTHFMKSFARFDGSPGRMNVSSMCAKVAGQCSS